MNEAKLIANNQDEASEVWKAHFGSIPEGHQVYYKDGNRNNCSIENLFISTPELVKYSKFRNRMPRIGADYLGSGKSSRVNLRTNVPRAYSTTYSIR